MQILDNFLDFGKCSRSQHVEPLPIRVKNNTLGKITCVWTSHNVEPQTTSYQTAQGLPTSSNRHHSLAHLLLTYQNTHFLCYTRSSRYRSSFYIHFQGLFVLSG